MGNSIFRYLITFNLIKHLFSCISFLKYMIRTAGYTWTDYKTNAQIAKDLKITNFGQITGIQEKLDRTCK